MSDDQKKRRGGGKPSSRLVREQRVRELEDALVAGVGRERALASLAAKWGVSDRTARRYMATVLERWAEAEEEGYAERRAKVRAQIEAQILRAVTRKRYARDPATRKPIVLNPEEVEAGAPPVYQREADPDERTISRALDLLIRLDGLAKPSKVEIDTSDRTTSALAGASTESLLAFLSTGRTPTE